MFPGARELVQLMQSTCVAGPATVVRRAAHGYPTPPEGPRPTLALHSKSLLLLLRCPAIPVKFVEGDDLLVPTTATHAALPHRACTSHYRCNC